MSSTIVSALVAAALASVPPSFGSEAAPPNFDVVGAPAFPAASQGASLDASLGSEPLTGEPAAPKTNEHRADQRLAHNCTCK